MRSRAAPIIGTWYALLFFGGCRAVLGIEEPTDLAAPAACHRNSDCADPLLCFSGICGKECAANKDCPSGKHCVSGSCAGGCQTSAECPEGQRCVLAAFGDGGQSEAVCQAPSEARCTYNTDCPAPLVCGVDGQCRNQCVTKRDCVGLQQCAFGACATPQEIDAQGALKVPGDAGLATD